MAIQLASVASNVARDSNYQLNSATGLYERSVLLESARTNPLAWSNDFTNAAWSKTTVTVTTGVTDPKGGTAACTLTATAASSFALQNLGAGASSARTNSIWARRRTGVGTVSLGDAAGTTMALTLTSSWQRFSFPRVADTARQLAIVIATNGDAIDVYNAQQDLGSYPTSDIITGAGGTTCPADALSFPFPYSQLEMTLYASFFDVGIGQASSGVVYYIGTFASSVWRTFVDRTGGSWRLYLDSTGTNGNSTSAVTTAYGDLVELRAIYRAAGTVQLGVSVNGGTESVATVSSAVAGYGGTAWSNTTMCLGNDPVVGASSSYLAFKAVKALRGVRTVAEMRAA